MYHITNEIKFVTINSDQMLTINFSVLMDVLRDNLRDNMLLFDVVCEEKVMISIVGLYLDCVFSIDIDNKIIEFFVSNEIDFLLIYQVYQRIHSIMLLNIKNHQLVRNIITNHYFIMKTIINLYTNNFPVFIEHKII